MNGKKLIAMGLIVTLSASAAACGKAEEETAETDRVAVEVLNPETGEVAVDTAYIGTVAPQEQVYVIPKTSGTVTATFFEVGDTVQEGDVLFKIDDEAAQLQLASAKAAYTTAEAGIVAQNDGARDLQNYQTERQIQQLRDTLNDTDGTISDLEDNLGDVRDAAGKISEALNQAKAGVTAATDAYYAAKPGLEAKIQSLKDQIEAAASTSTDDGASEQPVDPSAEQPESPSVDVEDLQKQLESAQKELEGYKAGVDTAQAGVNQLQTQLDSLNATKTQLKSGIDQAEDGMDTIRDNLTTAEQAYAITQNEIYPQTDAVGSAQLGQTAIGIDSAQMQLDFCTVTSPITGVVESVSVEKNGMAAAGNIAYIISNKESMTVTFQVTEKAKNALQIGDHVTVERSGNTYEGTITEIGTMVGQQTKLFQIKATVAGAGDNLPNGVSVKVYATTQKEAGKLVIPYDTIYFEAGDAYVYCVEDDVIVKKPVTVGLMSDTEAAIEEGLSADSMVVSNWSSKLRNGAKAEVVSANGEASGPAEEATADTVEDTEETPENTESEETDMTEEAE